MHFPTCMLKITKKCLLKNNFFLSKSSIYPDKNTKSLKTKPSFKINFWTTVNEKGVFQMWLYRHNTSKGGKNTSLHSYLTRSINVWNTFWSTSKLTIDCLEIPFSKNSYYRETSQKFCNTKQLAGFQTVNIFSEKYFQTVAFSKQCSIYGKTRSLIFTSKMCEKTPAEEWKFK